MAQYSNPENINYSATYAATDSRQFNRSHSSLAFKLLIFFTLLLYLSPQSYFPFLEVMHLARASAILGIIAFFLNLRNAPRLSMNNSEKAIAVFSMLAVVSIPFSMWQGGSFSYFTEIYLKVLIIFYLMSRVLTSADKMKTMISVLVWCSVYYAVVGVWHFSHQIYFIANRIGGPGGGMAEDPNDLALWLVMMVPFALQRYNLADTKSERLLNLGIIVIYLAGIYVSYSRGGFLGLVTISGVYLLRMSGKKRFGALLGVSVFIVILAFSLPQNYADRMDSILHPEKDQTGSAEVRFQAMQVSLEEAFDHPVFGSGIGMNLLALLESGKFNPTVFVHSAPLQVVSELGFPALFVYAYLFYSTLKTLKGVRKSMAFDTDTKLLSAYAGAIEASLWGFVVSGFFLPVAYRWYSFYIIGLASALINIVRQSSSSKGRLSDASKG